MFGGAWRLGSIGGIPFRVDPLLLIVVLLLTGTYWSDIVDSYPSLGRGGAFGVALGIALALVASVLFHELAHALVARLRDIPVAGITLLAWGGATETRMEDRGAADEFLVTAAGPGSSLLLAGAFTVIGQSSALPDPVAEGALFLGRINLLLGLFNLLPGFPLDGGRVLRSIIWRITGNLQRATRIAAAVGQVFGLALVAYGLYIVIFQDSIFGLWTALIGWMIASGARAASQQAGVGKVLAEGTAGDAMGPAPEGVPAGISLSEALDRYLMGREQETFLVVEGDRAVGALTFEAAGRVGREDPTRPVRDAMLPLDRAPVVGPDERLDEVVQRLGNRPAVFVVDDQGSVLGTIRPADLSRWVRSRAAPA
jgi:Zn-dependent protease